MFCHLCFNWINGIYIQSHIQCELRKQIIESCCSGEKRSEDSTYENEVYITGNMMREKQKKICKNCKCDKDCHCSEGDCTKCNCTNCDCKSYWVSPHNGS